VKEREGDCQLEPFERAGRESELTLSGASEFLKSQTMMMGEASSSEAVMTDMGCKET